MLADNFGSLSANSMLTAYKGEGSLIAASSEREGCTYEAGSTFGTILIVDMQSILLILNFT